MYDFIIQISVVVSLGVIIYLLARAVPRVSDDSLTANVPNRFDKIISQIPTQKIDKMLNLLFEKFLRKVKVVIMKIDNLVGRNISRLNRNSKEKPEADKAFPSVGSEAGNEEKK